MRVRADIPVFTLLGETAPFPDVVHCERFSERAPLHNWQIAAHRHAHICQVFLVEQGGIDAEVDGATWQISAGMFLYVPADAVHQLTFDPQSTGMVISVPLGGHVAAGPQRQTVDAALARPVRAKADAALRQVVHLLELCARAHTPFRTARAVALTQALLASVAEHAAAGRAPAQAPAHRRLAALDALIADPATRTWRAEEFAAALALSPGHVRRLCRTATGAGLSAYVEGRRLREACRLLAFSDMPVAVVGDRLGFADPSYFSKRFRKMQGCSPSRYRAQFTGRTR